MPGTLLTVGAHTVTCTATDTHGNPASNSFTITVTDTTKPTLSNPPASFSVEATSPNATVVTYTLPTASDNGDPSPIVTCTPGRGTAFPFTASPIAVSCTAKDASNNTSDPVNFTVTLVDTTNPVLVGMPASFSVQATSSAGAVATYTPPTATDNADPSPSVNCTPASGSTFPLGATTVTCTADDHHGHTTSATTSVTVTDTTGPTFAGGSGNLIVEANGPSGSIVNYTSPTAIDLVDGPRVVLCAPASGTVFALGTTTVTCSATDSHGNPSSKTIHITVVDTTPPNLTVPVARSVYATTPTGIPDTVSAIVSFLSEASATDIVDPSPAVTNSATHFLPIGNLTITFGARDFSGNVTYKSVTLIVLPQPTPGTPPLPVPPAVKPPADVRNLKATSGDHTARLVWVMPAGVAYVTVTRWTSVARRTAAQAPGEVVYKGTGTSYVDRGLQNGLEYRYVVTSYDAAGNGSAGVPIVVVPRRDLLQAPKTGARLRQAPRLVWEVDRKAAYYNVQLIRNGKKILSVWPTKPQYTLSKTWKFAGRKYSLTPGTYQWFVWPGYGPRSAVDYGELLGTRTFQILP